MKLKLFLLIALGLLLINCTSKSQSGNVLSLNYGDSITTIDSVSYYWLQIAEDSARISAVKDGEVINECLVTGPVYGAVPTDDERFSDRFFFIVCGEDQYQPFDTQNIPSEMNLMTEEEWENYDIESEHADSIINL